ncbi:MAG: WS/DGAT domain-containing protein [Propionicimonas sp.]|uniref:WS/DGAT domain-containing protein n=1 Tax=Propionicimonas sp. TaxID=1955623 RepID=UPI003D0F4883
MERFSFGDAAELAGDVGPDQRLIGVLAELDGPVDAGALRAAVAASLPALPVLQRRFVRHGRAAWAATWESVSVRLAHHVLTEQVDDPVRATERILVRGLPEDVPMWRLVLLESPHAHHLLFVAHHALLDGGSAMAVVGALVGIPSAAVPAARRRNPLLAPLGLAAGMAPGVSATSLLVPITSGFRIASTDVPLTPLLQATRAAGATVNDAVLLAVGEALRAVGAGRDERLRRVRVSVPVAGQPQAGNDLGRNLVGAFVASVPLRRPGEGDRALLARIAARTRWRKLLARGYSGTPALSLLLAVLGCLGWYRPLFSRQRAITSLVTNLRGPAEPVDLEGARVRSLTPVSPALGNVTVVFAALSYAGTLRVTARLDRTAWPEEELITATVAACLRRISTGSLSAGP